MAVVACPGGTTGEVKPETFLATVQMGMTLIGIFAERLGTHVPSHRVYLRHSRLCAGRVAPIVILTAAMVPRSMGSSKKRNGQAVLGGERRWGGLFTSATRCCATHQRKKR